MSVNLGNDTKATSPVRTPEDTKESKYEPKQNKKIIRLLTVIAYVISVSMAAIILSLYYVFLWDPQIKYPIKGKHAPASTKAPSSEETAPALNSLPFSSLGTSGMHGVSYVGRVSSLLHSLHHRHHLLCW